MPYAFFPGHFPEIHQLVQVLCDFRLLRYEQIVKEIEGV